jgi:hypothetical protein
VVQMVSELTITVLRARMGQLRRMRWRIGQRCGYVRMHGAWFIWEGQGMVHMLLIEHMVQVCQYWIYERGQEETFLAWVN